MLILTPAERSDLVSCASGVLRKAFGCDAVTSDYGPTMGCEEFSLYLEHVPGIFMLIGGHGSGGPIVEIHNPRLLFPQECLQVDVRALCEIALNYTGTEYES